MSVLLLVPTMTFNRDVVVLVHPVVACRACLDFIQDFLLLFNLLEDATMYGSVPQSDGCARVWVKAASTHLKGASIFLMYDCPKILSFIATMGLKVHPHF